MKSILIFTSILLLIACQSGKTRTSKSEFGNQQETMPFDSPVFREWILYYQGFNDNFKPGKFLFSDSTDITYEKGNVFATFDAEFDTIYSRFLVYNQSRDKYVDFDSYYWSIDENGQIQYEIDQEVNLVDLNKETVNRIAFYGSTQWVEDAFWTDDNTLVLLMNSDEKRPLYTVYDFKKNKKASFMYPTVLKENSSYSDIRSIKILGK